MYKLLILILLYLNIFRIGYLLSDMTKTDLKTKKVKVHSFRETIFYNTLNFCLLLFYGFFEKTNVFFVMFVIFFHILLYFVCKEKKGIDSLSNFFGIKSFVDMYFVFIILLYLYFFSVRYHTKILSYISFLLFYSGIIVFYLKDIVDAFVSDKIKEFEVPFIPLLSIILLFVLFSIEIILCLEVVGWPITKIIKVM